MKKARKYILKTALLVLAIAVAGLYNAYSQSDDKESIKRMIEAREYTFNAQTAIPQRGRTQYLTGEYDLKVSKDTVISYLPFFGRAYSAPIDPSKGGIKFTSTDFSYAAAKKKRGWEITITPKDTQSEDVRYLVLSISDDGYGTLRVFSTNRSGISFSGYITGSKQK